jgi:serine/threonine protein kinase
VSEPHPQTNSSGSPPLARRIEQACNRFEAAWKSNPPVKAEDFLGETPEPERSALLRELLVLELECRRRAGEVPGADEYLARLPGQTELVHACFDDSAPPGGGRGAEEKTTGRRPSAPAPRYRILRPHGRGGLGQVSMARDEQLRREVALKEIRPERGDDPGVRQRFLAEAEITCQLQHPGVVPVYALEEGADGRPYYAMRFIEGRTLGEAIAQYHSRPTPLGFRGLLQRFVSVCQTLAYAHSKGVIHRDLKPANVMLGDYGETLVVDWGLAKRLGGTTAVGAAGNGEAGNVPAAPETALGPQTVDYRPAGADGLTVEGQVLGTPAYMPPEMAEGRLEEVGPAADVYALGAILYEVLTGRAPYRDRSAEEVLEQVRRGPPSSPSQVRRGVPRALEAVCLKAMARAIPERYSGAGEVAAEVERWLADEPLAAYREPVLVRLGRWRRQHKVLVNALAAAALVAGLFVGLAWWQKARRVAQVERDAAGALAEAAALGERAAGLTEQPAQWQSTLAAALSAVKLAQSLLAKEGAAVDADLWDKVYAVRAQLEADERDRRLVARVEEVRLEQAEVDLKRSVFKQAEAYPKVRAALAGYGLAIGQSPSKDAVAWLLQRPEAIQRHLVAALLCSALFALGKHRRAALAEGGTGCRRYRPMAAPGARRRQPGSHTSCGQVDPRTQRRRATPWVADAGGRQLAAGGGRHAPGAAAARAAGASGRLLGQPQPGECPDPKRLPPVGRGGPLLHRGPGLTAGEPRRLRQLRRRP